MSSLLPWGFLVWGVRLIVEFSGERRARRGGLDIRSRYSGHLLAVSAAVNHGRILMNRRWTPLTPVTNSLPPSLDQPLRVIPEPLPVGRFTGDYPTVRQPRGAPDHSAGTFVFRTTRITLLIPSTGPPYKADEFTSEVGTGWQQVCSFASLSALYFHVNVGCGRREVLMRFER